MASNGDRGHGGESPYPRAIFADEYARGILAAGIGMACDAPGENNAGGHALYVPFPGATLGFVKVVDVQRNLLVGRGKEAEVLYVRISAHLDFNFCVLPLAQIGGHDFNRPAKENEWRLAHQLEFDRQQLCDSVFRALPQNVDGIKLA